MPIQTGQNASPDDFINESEQDAVRTNDAGKVPKLESDGYVAKSFIKGPVDIQLFTADGTWTKPTNANVVEVVVIGGGGGGASGAKGASFNRRGGAGGGGGGFSRHLFNAATLSSSEAVTVGAGGSGGAASTGNNNSGGNGGDSSFGTLL